MPNKLPSILLGGLVVGVLSTSYLGLINLVCCLGVIVGAMTAVWHYTTTYQVTIPGGQGAVLGLLAALVGVVLSIVLTALLEFAGVPSIQELQTGFMERFYTQDQLDMMEEMQAEQQGFTLAAVIGAAIGALVFSIFGAIGGAIGAAVFKKGPEEPETY